MRSKDSASIHLQSRDFRPTGWTRMLLGNGNGTDPGRGAKIESEIEAQMYPTEDDSFRLAEYTRSKICGCFVLI